VAIISAPRAITVTRCLAAAPSPPSHILSSPLPRRASSPAPLVRSCGNNKGAKDNCNKQRLSPSGKKAGFLNSTLIKAISVTISITPPKGASTCADAPEDVMLSLVV
jgi:hypothetical protein